MSAVYPGRLESTGRHRLLTPVFAAKFCPDVNRPLLVCCNEVGDVSFSSAVSGEVLRHWKAHRNAVFDFTWIPGDPGQILTGSGDQTALLWDVETKICLGAFNGHGRSVKVVSTLADNSNIFATGSRDGTVRIWDVRSRRNSAGVTSAKQVIPCSKEDITQDRLNSASSRRSPARKPAGSSRRSALFQETYSVTSLHFQELNKLYAGTANDGYIRIWDLRKLQHGCKSPVALIPYPGGLSADRNHGYVHFITDLHRANLYAACADNNIYQFSLQSRSVAPIRQFVGSKLKSYYLRMDLSPCGNHLICGSTDSRAHIWQLSDKKFGVVQPSWFLEGHDAEVTCAAWSPRLTELATVSDDLSWRVWSIDQPKLRKDNQENIETAHPYPVGEEAISTTKRKPHGVELELGSNGEKMAKRLRLSVSSSSLASSRSDHYVPPTLNLPNRVLERLQMGGCSRLPPTEDVRSNSTRFGSVQPKKLLISPKKQLNKPAQPVTKVKCKSLMDFFTKL